VWPDKVDLSGQDYNWEYPQTREDWIGLKALFVETKVRSQVDTFVLLSWDVHI